MGMVTADSSITTIDRLLSLPEDGLLHELLDGVHVVTPSPALVHQLVHAELEFRLRAFVIERKNLMLFYAPSDVRLGPDTLVQPDITVVPIDPNDRPRNWSELKTPVLLVEIVSPGTVARDRGVKRELYQRAGIDEYWIVDIDARLIERWRPADERPEILRTTIAWQPHPDSEKLAIELKGLFAVAD
ncbi:MAG: Uma2 family endonuclease [Gemmatimonadales bacterium]